jgi:hypothetical protein
MIDQLSTKPFLLNSYFPDVWGFFTNGFLVMDGFADAGYLTLGLDYFRGVHPTPSTLIMLSS